MKHLILWLDYKIPSANEMTGRHWSRKHTERTAAIIELRSVFQSSPVVKDFLIRTTLLLDQNNSAMPLPNSLDVTTLKDQESNGNTPSASPEAGKGPL